MANPQAHYETTGREIWEDLGESLDWFVAGAGSGGTYSGAIRYIKEKKPCVQGVLADPVGSTMGGGEHGDYDIEGILKRRQRRAEYLQRHQRAEGEDRGLG